MWLVGGLIGMVAVYGALTDWFDLSWLPSILPTVIGGTIPILSSYLVIMGAIKSFGWPCWGALPMALPQLVILVLGPIALTAEFIRDRRL
jgi:hypothetical protein